MAPYFDVGATSMHVSNSKGQARRFTGIQMLEPKGNTGLLPKKHHQAPFPPVLGLEK